MDTSKNVTDQKQFVIYLLKCHSCKTVARRKKTAGMMRERCLEVLLFVWQQCRTEELLPFHSFTWKTGQTTVRTQSVEQIHRTSSVRLTALLQRPIHIESICLERGRQWLGQWLKCFQMVPTRSNLLHSEGTRFAKDPFPPLHTATHDPIMKGRDFTFSRKKEKEKENPL